jgi:hypothetical protein
VLLSSAVRADRILSANEQIINFFNYIRLTVRADGILISHLHKALDVTGKHNIYTAMKPRLIITLTFIIGLVLFFYSLTLPIYKDQKAADDLLKNSDKIDKQEYYKRDAELRTSKTTFMDLGVITTT